jgi:hypothetical protein
VATAARLIVTILWVRALVGGVPDFGLLRPVGA